MPYRGDFLKQCVKGALIVRYRLSKDHKVMRKYNDKLLDQLAGCQSEEARRLLLGKSR